MLIEDSQFGSDNFRQAQPRSASLKKTAFANRGGVPGGSTGSFGNFGEPALQRNARSQSYNQVKPRNVKVEGYFLHKVIVVTGASSGVGRALAYWYLNNGARVAIIGRDIRELDKIA